MALCPGQRLQIAGRWQPGLPECLLRLAVSDERHFVKEAVNWVLRHIGQRNSALNTASLALRRYRATSWRAVVMPLRSHSGRPPRNQ